MEGREKTICLSQLRGEQPQESHADEHGVRTCRVSSPGQRSARARQGAVAATAAHLLALLAVRLHQLPHVLVPPRPVVVASLLLRLDHQLRFWVQPWQGARLGTAAAVLLAVRRRRRLAGRAAAAELLLLGLDYSPAIPSQRGMPIVLCRRPGRTVSSRW